MKTVKELFHRLNTFTEFEDRYPQYDADDQKIHVLFLSPCMNESGYYRMILPALRLNGTETHSAILAHIHKWNFVKRFDDYDSPVDMKLIQWADYVVLPIMFTDASYIIQNIRKMNSDVEFVMDIDYNYHELPVYHPEYHKLNQEAKNMLIHNFSLVDLLTAPNHDLLNYYHRLIQERSDEFLLYFDHYPNLLSVFAFEEINELHKSKSDKLRIGMIADPSQVEDLKVVEKPIMEMYKKHGEKIEIIVFGSAQKVISKHGLFIDLPVTYELPVNYLEFHQRLNALALDIGLLPMVDNKFNVSGRALNRYLDFSSLMIPVVMSSVQPFNQLIKESENGYLATSDEDWTDKVDKLISDQLHRESVGVKAYNFVWKHFSYDQKALERLQNVFV